MKPIGDTTQVVTHFADIQGQATLAQLPPGLTGGGSFNSVQAQVDFGFSAGNEGDTASVTVVATWVTASSKILCTVAMIATADHDAQDGMVEGLIAYAANIVEGVGFDIVVRAPNGTWGKYIVQAIG